MNVKVIKGFRKNVGGKNHRVNWLKASDHYAFHKNDIPFIYYGVGLHKNYHTSKDTYKNANKDLYVKSTNLIHQKILFIDHAINKVD